MMRYFFGSVLAGLLFLTLPVSAEERPNPVVVELFTSQGCSSCPPADALLHELAKRDDVIALALHVDYWDYIGWKDEFAQPAFTARQKAYARTGNRRSIYTPQMIIGGREALVGHDAMKIVMAIDEHRRTDRPARMDVIARTDGDAKVTVRLTPMAYRPIGILQLIRYKPSETVKIKRGENAGKTLTYSNIVQDWRVIGTWDGVETDLEVDVPGPDPAVLILQEDGHRDILASARLK